MARSFVLIAIAMMFLLCIGIFDFKYIEDYSKEPKQTKRKVTRLVASNLDEFADIKYNKLCRGEILQPAYIQKKLKCRYVDRGIPFLKIAPFKEEEAYLDPRIVVYHDVIYEDEIEALKILSEPELESARVGNFLTGKVETSKDRIAKSVFLREDDSEHLNVLSRRVEHMTGLKVYTAESLQIAYYDVGGLYFPHYDTAIFYKGHMHNFEQWGIGNRIATVLFYMNDVSKGGGTVFPALDVTLRPKKGSAAFWHNLKRNGKRDLSTLHGACPVLSGTKWIATKWLHETGQEFLRPCTLSENE